MRPPNHDDNDVKLKTCEDYHVAIHDKLLEARKEVTDFINVNLIYCYGIVGLIVLYLAGYLKTIKLSEGTELDLTKGYMLEFLSAFVMMVYLPISFHFRRLGQIFRGIRENASSLKYINHDAKIVGIEDMHLYVGGFIGFILGFAREQARIITLKRQFQRSKLKLAPKLVLSGILYDMLILIPLAFPMIAIAMTKNADKLAAHFQVNPIDIILLVAFIYVTGATFLSNIALKQAYYEELTSREFKVGDPIWIAHRPKHPAVVTQFWDPDEAAKLFPHGVMGAAKGPPYIDGVVAASFVGRDPFGREYPNEIAAGTSVERRL